MIDAAQRSALPVVGFRHLVHLPLAVVAVGTPITSADLQEDLVADFRRLGTCALPVGYGALSGRHLAPKARIAPNAGETRALLTKSRGARIVRAGKPDERDHGRHQESLNHIAASQSSMRLQPGIRYRNTFHRPRQRAHGP